MTNRSFAQQTDNSLSSCLLALRKSFAFTLAEVLITLGIIGVVAAMTIPNLITNYQKKVAITRLKEAHNIISNAYISYIQDTGGLSSEDFARHYIYLTLEENYIFKYMNAKKIIDNKYRLIRTTKKEAGTFLPRGGIFYLAQNGFRYWMTANCALSSSNTPYPFCNWAEIWVDIDGNGKVNQVGRDVFAFHVQFQNPNKPVVFFNTTKSFEQLEKGCSRTSSEDYGTLIYNGNQCLDVIVKNNWEFPKNYPW